MNYGILAYLSPFVVIAVIGQLWIGLAFHMDESDGLSFFLSLLINIM